MESDVLAARLGQALLRRGWVLAVAESCTGGGIAAAVTSVPGSSQWFERGFVTYTDLSKQEMLGVDPAILVRHGAVSEETARLMVEGAIAHSHANLAVAVTGIAGPDGAAPGKPVGTVCLAWAGQGHDTVSTRFQFVGDRHEVRSLAVLEALRGALHFLEK